MTSSNGKLKANANLPLALKALRPQYGAGTARLMPTTVSIVTLARLNDLVSSGTRSAVIDTALRLFLCLVSPDAKAAQNMGVQLGEALAEHGDIVERISDNLVVLLDNLHVSAGDGPPQE